jgi:hypothetical protein
MSPLPRWRGRAGVGVAVAASIRNQAPSSYSVEMSRPV